MAHTFDREWYRALKAALRDVTSSKRRILKLVWENPGVPVYLLPKKDGKKPSGAVWLAIGGQLAKSKLWERMPRHIRAQNSRPGDKPFYSGILIELSTIIDGNGNRFMCFDFHPEVIRALRDLQIIKGKQPPRSSGYVPVSEFKADRRVIGSGTAAETEKVLQAIKIRRGQALFRNKLLQAYDGTCAVTGCTELGVLEAAHIKAFSRQGRYEAKNGLLLRADWHLLFDMNLWAIHPKTGLISISNEVEDAGYRRFQGKSVILPKDPKLAPAPQALAARYRIFQRKLGR